jgi:hypothetical protein
MGLGYTGEHERTVAEIRRQSADHCQAFFALPFRRGPAAAIGDDAHRAAGDSGAIARPFQECVKPFDRSRLLDVERLSRCHTRGVIDEHDPRHTLAARKRVRDSPAEIPGPDDAGGRHQLLEYSS